MPTKKRTSPDWHKADIKAALHKRGLTFKGLSLAHGYRSVDACAQALHRPYPKVERIIAAALEVPPETIWPSRYRINKRTNSSASRAAAAVYPRTAG